MTDEEAEARLPRHPLVLRQYRLYRDEGCSIEEALRLTLRDWRDICQVGGFVLR